MATIITNKNNIPELFYRAALIDRHVTKGDISVTQMIDAPQIRYLKTTQDIEVDVEDRLAMLFGTAIHGILERAEVAHVSARQLLDAVGVLEEIGTEETKRAAEYLRGLARSEYPDAFNDDNLIEKTLSCTFDIDGMPIELSGTVDKYEGLEKTLRDYKITSVYSYIYEESRHKWYSQQNVYAYMLRQHGFPVEKAYISAFFKDWKRMEAMRKGSSDYPKKMAMDIEVPLHDDKKVEAYIKSRLRKHLEIFDKKGDIPCTGKEMWSEAPVFAVMKEGRKRSLKNFAERSLAEKYLEDQSINHVGLYIEDRPGENRRCDKFCAVRDICPQKAFNDKQKEKKDGEQFKDS
jgi:hypothetical protein